MTEIFQEFYYFVSDYQRLEVIGVIIGLVYIYQEYKASLWLWLTGLIMPVIYLFVYYKAGLYADFGMQIYYILAAIYGFLYWKFGAGNKKKEVKISHISHRGLVVFLQCFLLLWGVIYWLLTETTNSTVPALDSFGNALSIIGLWALAKKYIEQWIIWMIADVELAALYFHKDIPFTACLYVLYAIIAVFGYLNWKKMMASDIEKISK